MKSNDQFLTWLSQKMYVNQLGFYLTLIFIFTLPSFFVRTLGIKPILASFLAFFIVVFARALYESALLYQAPISRISFSKIGIFSVITTSVIILIAALLKPSLGYLSIPISVITTFMVVGKVKSRLWPNLAYQGFFKELPKKLNESKIGTYVFYTILVGITYFFYSKLDANFFYAFGFGLFFAIMYEELYNFLKIYQQKLTPKTLATFIIWAICCALLGALITFIMMKKFGYSGQPATIAGVILMKLIQPLAQVVLMRNNI